MMFFDDQTGLMLATGSMETQALQQNIAALARVAHIFHLPVVLTTSAATNPQGPGPLIPELQEAFPDLPPIDRTTIGA